MMSSMVLMVMMMASFFLVFMVLSMMFIIMMLFMMVMVLFMMLSMVFPMLMPMITVFSLMSVSFRDSLLRLVNFSLGDLSISLISPHCIRSQMESSTVEPGLII